MKLIMQFQSPVTSSCLGPNIFFSTLFSDTHSLLDIISRLIAHCTVMNHLKLTLSLCASLHERDQFSHQAKL